MVEAVPGERGVVGLDVQLVLVFEAVAGQEAVDGGGVVVVLVLGRLLGLGLDEQHALEADLGLVLGHQVQETGELLALSSQVGVQEGVVALTAAPQDVVRAAQSLRDLEHVADLRGRVGEDLRVGVGRGPALIARVGEEIGRAPQELDAGPFLVAQRIVHERVQVGLELGERGSLGRHVHVVEAVVGHAQLLEELEGDGHLQARCLHRIHGRIQPRPIERPGTEHVSPIPGERVPQAHADAEVLLHALAQDHAIGIVDLECQRIGGLQPGERDGTWNLGEERLCHLSDLPSKATDLLVSAWGNAYWAKYQARHAFRLDKVTCVPGFRSAGAAMAEQLPGCGRSGPTPPRSNSARGHAR